MFCILFHEREGSSAMVNLLDNVDGLDMIFFKNGGIEPFDTHACKMKRKELNMMFENLFHGKEFEYSGVDELRPFGEFFGFKVRQNITKRCDFVNIVNKYNIPVIILYRESVFDWALSKYHGNGRGGGGHIQFDMKAGKVKELKKMRVDPGKLKFYMNEYEKNCKLKLELYAKINRRKVISYERFCEDKESFLYNILHFIGFTFTKEIVDDAIMKGCYYEKVHKNYDWILNFEEIKCL